MVYLAEEIEKDMRMRLIREGMEMKMVEVAISACVRP